jgi:hypothetical protein
MQWGMAGMDGVREVLYAYPNLTVLGLSALVLWVLSRTH